MIFIITVFLAGNPDDLSMSDYFIDRLKNDFSITYLNNGLVRQTGEGPEILLIEEEKIISESINNSVIVFKKDCIPLISGKFLEENIAIISSHDKSHLKKISGQNIETITCGSSPKDTVTYSSSDDETIVVSLQREITSFGKKAVLPFEMPVKRHCNDDYNILSFFALSVKIGFTEKNSL